MLAPVPAVAEADRFACEKPCTYTPQFVTVAFVEYGETVKLEIVGTMLDGISTVNVLEVEPSAVAPSYVVSVAVAVTEVAFGMY